MWGKQTVLLTDGEEVEVIFGNGKVVVDSYGGVVREIIEDERCSSGTISQASASMYTTTPSYTQTKLDSLNQYLMILFESNRCGHKVDNEIDEALRAYKEEVGI